MNGIYLLLGSNLGDRLTNIKRAIELMDAHGIRVLNSSSIYETAPWGEANQGWFLNCVIQIEAPYTETQLLNKCLQIEEEMGRVREKKWGERIIDIDILYFNDVILDTETLKLPHPGIPDRRFTLLPLAELCPSELHPLLHQTQTQLLANCADTLDCRLTELQL